jgi:hypothetical protein
MCGSTVRVLGGVLPLLLILLIVPSHAPAGVCCLAPEKTCETVDDCGGGPCGPPCDDHLKCYRIRDSVRVGGVVNLDAKQFGLEPGCRIVGPQLFCVPATKTVKEAVDTSTSPPTPIEPKPISGPPAPGDRLCYRIRCEKGSDQKLVVEDQFGTHEISSLRPALLCTPAVKKTGCTGDDECPIGQICHESRCADCVCPDVWAPVCGIDGVTYGNACEARCAHVEIAHEGPCEAECRCNADCSDRAVCREGRCQVSTDLHGRQAVRRRLVLRALAGVHGRLRMRELLRTLYLSRCLGSRLRCRRGHLRQRLRGPLRPRGDCSRGTLRGGVQVQRRLPGLQDLPGGSL